MGKKAKKKSRGHPKGKKTAPMLNPAPDESSPGKKPLEDAAEAVERKLCVHFNKGVDLDKVLAKIKSAEYIKCEGCKQNVNVKRGSKRKVKNGKKGSASSDSTSESKAIWVCLECGHFACAGVGLPTGAQSHVVRHVRQTRHRLVIQWENPHLRWCFPCNVLLPVEKAVENGENKDVLMDVVKLMKERVSGSRGDADSHCEGSDGVTCVIKSEGPAQNGADTGDGYMAKGLSNLGNTCYFNSIMQNLLALDPLRDCFLNEDTCAGPLFTSLKKLYAQTKPDAGLKNVIDPKALHGTLSSKAPQFKGYEQHDSHELLRCLLDGLSSEEADFRKKLNASGTDKNPSNQGPTLVDAVFGGQISSTVSCMECSHSSSVCEPFLDLSLPVPAKKPVSKRPQSLSRAKKTKLPPKKAAKVRAKVVKDAGSVSSNSVSKPQLTGVSPDEGSTFVFGEIVGSSKGPFLLGSNSPTVKTNGSNCVLQNSFATPGTTDGAVGSKPETKLEHVGDSTWMDVLEGEMMQDEDALLAQDKECPPVAAADGNDSTDQRHTFVFGGVVGSSKGPFVLACNAPTLETNVSNSLLQNPITVPGMEDSAAESESVMKHEKVGDSTRMDFLGGETMQDEDALVAKNKENLSITAANGTESPDHGCTFEFGAIAGPLVGPLVSDEQASNGREHQNATLVDDLNNPTEAPLPSNGQASGHVTEQKSELTGLDYLGPDDNGSSSQSKETSSTSGRDQIHSIGACKQHNSSGDLLEEELPLQAQHSEVLLLPYKEENVIPKDFGTGEAEASSAVVNSGEQEIDFDGFGGMFNEPEIAAGPVIGPTIGPENSSTTNISGESDPDEVDTNSPVSVESCLGQFTKPEILCDENAWICENCSKNLLVEKLRAKKRARIASRISGEDDDPDATQKADGNGQDASQSAETCDSAGSEDEEINSNNVKVKRNASKRVLINKVPQILTIHLKRFSQDARGRLSKLHGHVAFREFLDLEPFMDSGCAGGERHICRLVGVVEHSGTMGSGHYIAFVRGGDKKRRAETKGDCSVWYMISDAYVRQVSLDQVLSCEAYILFYEKF